MNKNNLIFSLSPQNLIKYGFAALFLKGCLYDLTVVLSTAVLGQKLTIILSIIDIASITLMAIGIIECMLKQPKAVIIPYFVLTILWLASSHLHPENNLLLEKYWQQFFCVCVPYFCFFYYFFCKERNSEQKEENILVLYKLGYARLFITILSQTIMFLIPRANIYGDYMDAANTLLVGLVFTIAYSQSYKDTFNNRDILKKTVIFICFAYILFLGSRGGLVCGFIAWILCKLFGGKKVNAVKTIFISFTLLTIVILLKPTASLMISLGLDSRTIDMLAGTGVFYDPIRESLYEFAIEKALENPFGYGIMGDRTLILNALFFGNKGTSYIHNIILELAIDFGWFCIPILVIFIVICVKALISSSNRYKALICVLVSVSFIKLMFSSSFWMDQMFWGLLGTIIALSKQNKLEQSKTKWK